MATASASYNDPFQIAYRFSNVFGVKKCQADLEFVDIIVDTDIALYLDPFALSIEPDDWSAECNNLVVGFFQELIDSLRAKRVTRAREILGNLHEPNETRLGQSRGKPQGRGVGRLQAGSLYRAFSESEAIETGILRDLSDCELFIDGISHDKISDITTNIIRRKLVEFTGTQCSRWGIPTRMKPTGPFWHNETKEWRSIYAPLPVYLGQPIILVPKWAVRYKMAIDDREYYSQQIVEFIRQEFNRAENANPGSSLLKLLRSGIRVTKKDVEAEFPKSKDLLRKFSELFPDLLQKYKTEAREAVRGGKHKPTDTGIYEKIKDTAHDQGKILIEELHLHLSPIDGGSPGTTGIGNHTESSSMHTILIIAANPKGTPSLRLDEEVKKIEQGLERSKRRDQFKLVQKWAVTDDDLRRALLDHEPEIVHFSGHGSGADGLAFEDDIGKTQLISGDALSRLFELCSDHVKCVVLNACYSQVQADAIVKHIDYVVGMNKAIGDEAAVKFAVGFYDALGAGRDFEKAFKFGCIAIDLKGIPEYLTPVLKTRQPQATSTTVISAASTTTSQRSGERTSVAARLDDIVCEIKRDTVGRYLLAHPTASDNEIKDFIERNAKDKRRGEPGTDFQIHDESGVERALKDWLSIIREEIRTGVIHR